MAYRAIIFDFFDVISPDEFKAWLSRSGYKREGAFAEASVLLDEGKITADEFFMRLALASGMDVSKLRADFKSEAIDYEIISLIDELRAEYAVGLLSNARSEFLRGILQRNDLERHFDAITISSEVGHAKPSAEIFQHILSKMQVEPHEVVFIDDSESHILGAQQLGIQAIQYVGLSSLRNDLKRIGI